jgi:hypothetical protein
MIQWFSLSELWTLKVSLNYRGSRMNLSSLQEKENLSFRENKISRVKKKETFVEEIPIGDLCLSFL